MAEAVLFSQMTPKPEDEVEFNDWYDHEHVPARLALDGFTSAARYRSSDPADPAGREYVAVYTTDSLAAFDTPEYAALRANPSERTTRMLASVSGFTRFTCTVQSDVGSSGPADYLYVVAFVVPDDRRQAYDDWYEQEHVPMLMEAKEWQRITRLVVVEADGGPWTHLTFHYLSSPAALDSPERAAARVAPMRATLVTEPWFERSWRHVYKPLASSEEQA